MSRSFTPSRRYQHQLNGGPTEVYRIFQRLTFIVGPTGIPGRGYTHPRIRSGLKFRKGLGGEPEQVPSNTASISIPYIRQVRAGRITTTDFTILAPYSLVMRSQPPPSRPYHCVAPPRLRSALLTKQFFVSGAPLSPTNNSRHASTNTRGLLPWTA